MPDDPTITDHDGDVLFKLGDEKQALPQWQRSFVLDPENAKVAEKLKARSIDLEPLRKEAAEYKKKHDEEEAKKADAESSDLDQDVSSSPEDLMAPPSDDTNEPPSDLDEDPESAPED